MIEDLDIIKMKQWASGGCLLKDFYSIFNIPFPTCEMIPKAIYKLSELFHTYSRYIAAISTDNKRNKIEEKFKLLVADIFGELGVSVKLAGEGFVSYSLREIRSVLDLLFAGLFTISSWTLGSQEEEEGINPMAEAFFSGYWGKMNVLSLDSLILPQIYFGEENKGKTATISLEQLTNKCYSDIISEFNFKIHEEEELKLKKSLSNSLRSFFMNLIKDSNEWSKIAKETLGKTEHFYEILMNNNEATLRACENHEEEMLKDLSQKLGIKMTPTEDTKQKFLQLTFKVEKYNSILCNYCEDKATIYGIYSRPDTRAMSKLIKLQLQSEELERINSCVVDSFRKIQKSVKDSYFGDIIYSEIYSKLNDYVHSNITKEPTISQWFYDFFVPTVIVLQCILSRPLWLSIKTSDR